jgi:hypothetical protein
MLRGKIQGDSGSGRAERDAPHAVWESILSDESGDAAGPGEQHCPAGLGKDADGEVAGGKNVQGGEFARKGFG